MQQLKQLKEQANKSKDMNKYKQNREELFQVYLDNVKIKVDQDMPKELRHASTNIVLLGRISSGKSSLLNKLLGLNLKVGVGQTTTDKTSVSKSKDEKIQIWDCPGINDEEYSLFDVKDLLFFVDAGLVLILYPDSVKTVKEFCQAMWKLQPENTVLVRTQCDKFTSSDFKSIEQELETDRKILEGWKIRFPYPIFATSAKMGLDFMDNGKLRELMMNPTRSARNNWN